MKTYTLIENDNQELDKSGTLHYLSILDISISCWFRYFYTDILLFLKTLLT